MSSWGKNDNTSNSVIWASRSIKKRPNTANKTAIFNNSNTSNLKGSVKIGVYGVSATEIKYLSSNTADGVAAVNVISSGTVNAYPAISFSGGSGNNAAVVANVSVKLVSLSLSAQGTNYNPGDVLSVAGGNVFVPATVKVSMTEVSTVAVSNAGSGYANGQTANVGLAQFTITTGANTTSVASLVVTTRGLFSVTNPALANSVTTSVGGGTGLTVNLTMRINATANLVGGQYYSLPLTLNNGLLGGAGSGAQANLIYGVGPVTIISGSYSYANVAPTVSFTNSTGANTVAVLGRRTGAAVGAVTHSGWVLRREGTGGRAGRVTYETLVATGSIQGDSSSTDDNVFPSA